MLAKMNHDNQPLSIPQVSDSHKRISDKVKNIYEAGVAYKQSIGLFEKCAEYDNFYNSEHWPAATKETKNFPRPVINKFASIINQKVAGVLHDLGEIHFLPVEQEQFVDDGQALRYHIDPIDFEEPLENYDISASEALSLVAKHELQRMEFRDLLSRECLTAALMGTMCILFTWDNTLVGGGANSRWVGNVVAQGIDPVDIYVVDPKQHEIQEQPGIVITERKPLSQVKDFYGQFSDEVNYLQPDERSRAHLPYSHERFESDEADYVDLYHYWAKEAVEHEVEIGGEKVKRIGYQVNYYVVCQDRVIREDKDISKSGLYPIASMQWYPKRKSFYGKPESADQINNQKELNRLAGMGLLSIYTTGLPNVRYKEGYVKKEEIPAGAGGIIKDTSQLGVWAIDYMQPPQAPAILPYLRDSLIKSMEDTACVHEAWMGKAPSAQLNASAIIALQEAAGVTIGDIQQRLHRFLRDCGRILLSFWKEKWDYARLIRVIGDHNPNKVKGVFWFKGTDLADMEFDIMVSSGPSPFSRAIIAATLDTMLQYGAIDGQEYLELLPPESFPKVRYILERRKQREEEARQLLLEQQFKIVEKIAEEVVIQAQARGVEIGPEALEQLWAMVKESSQQIEQGKEESVA